MTKHWYVCVIRVARVPLVISCDVYYDYDIPLYSVSDNIMMCIIIIHIIYLIHFPMLRCLSAKFCLNTGLNEY